jgi:hypothetical protein
LQKAEDWSEIEPIPTYAAYLRENKFLHDPALAEAVLAASNSELVREFDETIERINAIIENGVRTQEQADAITLRLDDLRDLIYGRSTPT